MAGCCEFLDFLHDEIRRACAESRDPARVADVVIAEVQANFGTERVYVAAPANSRMHEGMRMLRAGVPPDQVAARLRVHLSTAHRWRARIRRSPSTGLGKSDWVL